MRRIWFKNGVERMAWQIHIKLPTPEEEAAMEKSLDADLVKRAQAATGALLWLATRTRPELSVGVAAMSRLCTKAPKETIQIGMKIMEYLKRPTRGLVYEATAGPPYGAREQLKKPRTEKTVEAFSDISYASTKGYRSVQGQVYYYAGAPVMWSTSRQPFPTQSTAESELVALCEALVGGRAMTSLIAAIRDEGEEGLDKRLWGDNSAAISLATGEGQGSWRTRHLRIRAAILRSALQRGEWELDHLSGKELVADSFTKAVEHSTFEKALQDLCLQHETPTANTDAGLAQQQSTAKMALLIGSTLISGVSASNDVEEDDEMFWTWTCGLILMCVGAVYVSSMVLSNSIAMWRRLRETSGNYGKTGSEEHGSEPLRQAGPQVKVLRHEQGEEWELCSAASEHEEQQVTASELRQMMEQSRAAVSDPYNKMHGREPGPWVDSDQEAPANSLQRATGSQLPRRRKKKSGNRKNSPETLDDDAQEAVLRHHMQENLLGSVKRLGSKSATLTTSTALWQRLMRQSGTASGSADASSSTTPLPRSGLQDPSSMTPLPQSGLQESSPMTPLPQSGLRGSAPMRSLPQSGLADQRSGASAAATSSVSRRPSGTAAGYDGAASSTSSSRATASEPGPADLNQWNAFQHQYRGRHWGSDKMRAEYWKFKATGKKPL